MASAFVKFQRFSRDLGLGVHNLDTGVLRVYLTNATPNAATNAIKADLAEIATGNGYAGAIDISAAYSESGGTGSLTASNQTITASGGAIPSFRYAVLYNDTPTSPADPLIGYWDYGSSTGLADGEAITITFGATVLTIA